MRHDSILRDIVTYSSNQTPRRNRTRLLLLKSRCHNLVASSQQSIGSVGRYGVQIVYHEADHCYRCDSTSNDVVAIRPTHASVNDRIEPGTKYAFLSGLCGSQHEKPIQMALTRRDHVCWRVDHCKCANWMTTWSHSETPAT